MPAAALTGATAAPPAEAVPVDDPTLVARYLDGDVRAFEDLYRRHRALVMRRLTRLTGNGATAEELTQEAFLRAAQRMVPGREVRFRAWVLRIGTNLAIDHLRALRRQPQQSIETLVGARAAVGSESIADTEASVELRENSRFVASVLNVLSPRHRTVLIHREIEGLDYRSIAQRMGISTSAVETLLFRARGRFREEYTRRLIA